MKNWDEVKEKKTTFCVHCNLLTTCKVMVDVLTCRRCFRKLELEKQIKGII